MPEAQLEDIGSGLTPVTEGWLVVNVRDAEWWFSERRGARCAFENEYGDPPVEFAQFEINITVLEPGQTGLYHAESNQEAFLRLEAGIRDGRAVPASGRRTGPVCPGRRFHPGVA
jgi:hypothetical protein